jgi:predicted ribosome quality control (RQC) complex YloA/Tae2 family protein
MTPEEIRQIKDEIATELIGLKFGKIFQIDGTSIAIDFFPHSGRYLYISYKSRAEAAYLIRRKLKHIERDATHPTPFAQYLKKQFSGTCLTAVSADNGGWEIKFEFTDHLGAMEYLVVNLSLNGGLFVLDAGERIVASTKNSDLPGQQIGTRYQPPDGFSIGASSARTLDGESLSDLLDAEDLTRRAQEQFDRRVAEARKQINSEIRKRNNLLRNLENDRLKQGDPDQWKRYGDLLLANIGNFRRDGNNIIVTDYFDGDTPEISIPGDANASISEVAEEYFKRYAKARNGLATISERLRNINAEISALGTKLKDLERAELVKDELAMDRLLPAKKAPAANSSRKKTDSIQAKVPGARRFVSSDGFEILVGKKASDNDHLTFRIAGSLDMWLHAADYPGSHVIVRNPGKKEVPSRTLVEAAQLAAFYSDAREMPKAAVRHTLRKYVNKPRKGAPGLVSLSSFKTILVEPQIGCVSRPS